MTRTSWFAAIILLLLTCSTGSVVAFHEPKHERIGVELIGITEVPRSLPNQGEAFVLFNGYVAPPATDNTQAAYAEIFLTYTDSPDLPEQALLGYIGLTARIATEYRIEVFIEDEETGADVLGPLSSDTVALEQNETFVWPIREPLHLARGTYSLLVEVHYGEGKTAEKDGGGTRFRVR